jgi:hypothetical protein
LEALARKLAVLSIATFRQNTSERKWLHLTTWFKLEAEQ